MAKDQDDLFEVRVGRPRADRGDSSTRRAARSFERQIMHAVAKAGGDPRRIGKGRLSAAKGKARNGRFNARGRGAKVMRTLPRDTGWSFNNATGRDQETEASACGQIDKPNATTLSRSGAPTAAILARRTDSLSR